LAFAGVWLEKKIRRSAKTDLNQFNAHNW
jgi:hypothetical protein